MPSIEFDDQLWADFIQFSNQLEIKAVEVQLVQEDVAVIQSGLMSGQQLVVTDLIPVIEGMALAPQIDADAGARLQRSAFGLERE